MPLVPVWPSPSPGRPARAVPGSLAGCAGGMVLGLAALSWSSLSGVAGTFAEEPSLRRSEEGLFDAFDALPDDAIRGRIVLWNAPFTSYGETVKYRLEGARRASARVQFPSPKARTLPASTSRLMASSVSSRGTS